MPMAGDSVIKRASARRRAVFATRLGELDVASIAGARDLFRGWLVDACRKDRRRATDCASTRARRRAAHDSSTTRCARRRHVSDWFVSRSPTGPSSRPLMPRGSQAQRRSPDGDGRLQGIERAIRAVEPHPTLRGELAQQARRVGCRAGRRLERLIRGRSPAGRRRPGLPRPCAARILDGHASRPRGCRRERRSGHRHDLVAVECDPGVAVPVVDGQPQRAGAALVMGEKKRRYRFGRQRLNMRPAVRRPRSRSRAP